MDEGMKEVTVGAGLEIFEYSPDQRIERHFSKSRTKVLRRYKTVVTLFLLV